MRSEKIRMLTGDQLRMARAALKLSVKKTADLAGVDKGTIVRIEAGENAYVRTLKELRDVLERCGVVFLDAREGIHGPGVALACNVVVAGDAQHSAPSVGKPDSGLHSRAWDDEFEDATTSEAELSEDDRQLLEYIRTAPHLSDRGRDILTRDALKR
jgi:transcriptional regulator with XRE-family HTH domain